MPGQRHRLFINVIHACPNACRFCVDFKGETFYGFDLKHGHSATVDEIVSSVREYSLIDQVSEIYFCGIGEPLLRYDVVTECAGYFRRMLPPRIRLCINTSGTFYHWTPHVDFAGNFDLIQVSLNAENEEKYNRICRPKFAGAYQVLMEFLKRLRSFLEETGALCRVELSVVDTSEIEHLPQS